MKIEEKLKEKARNYKRYESTSTDDDQKLILLPDAIAICNEELEKFQLNQLAKQCFENAKAKGFNSYTPENADLIIPRDLMLIVSELSEALEALRHGRRAKLEYYLDRIPLLNGLETQSGQICFQNAIKDTFEDELADALIRIMHLCGMLNIDIDKHVEIKLQYNATRPAMHGGKKF